MNKSWKEELSKLDEGINKLHKKASLEQEINKNPAAYYRKKKEANRKV